jgi:hypothetical protein
MLWSTANWPATVTRHSPPSDIGRPVAAHVGSSVDEVAIRQEPLPRSHFIPHYRRYKFVPLEEERGSAPFITNFLTRWRWVSFSSTRLYPARIRWTEPPQCWKTENTFVPPNNGQWSAQPDHCPGTLEWWKSFCTAKQVPVILGKTRPLWSTRIMDFTPRVNKQKSFLHSSCSTNVSYAMYIITSGQRVALLTSSKYRWQH